MADAKRKVIPRGSYVLRREFNKLAEFSRIDQNGLRTLWNEFMATLANTPEYDHIQAYCTKPSDNNLPVSKFKGEQIITYQNLYRELPPEYKVLADKVLGNPSDPSDPQEYNLEAVTINISETRRYLRGIYRKYMIPQVLKTFVDYSLIELDAMLHDDKPIGISTSFEKPSFAYNMVQDTTLDQHLIWLLEDEKMPQSARIFIQHALFDIAAIRREGKKEYRQFS